MQVPAADYGLNILDILRAPEKELNQVVGMKRLAPYREDAGRFRPNMAKLREMQVQLATCCVFPPWLPHATPCLLQETPQLCMLYPKGLCLPYASIMYCGLWHVTHM